MIYFTSDTHFSHKNVIDFCNRPFDNTEEMNQFIIESWNKTVNNDDVIYHLGDISFSGYEDTAKLLSQLKGKIYVCKGNHDAKSHLNSLVKEGLIEDWQIGYYIKNHKQKLWLSHIPMDIEDARSNMWSISGHIHGKKSKNITQINVGIDSPVNLRFTDRSFGTPFSMDDILHIMKSRKDV